MKLIATRSLRYNTRRLMAGDAFEASDMHGRLLIAIRKAQAAPPEKKAAAAKPAPPPPQEDDDIDRLRAQAGELGIEIDGRWGTVRLRHEIDQANRR